MWLLKLVMTIRYDRINCHNSLHIKVLSAGLNINTDYCHEC